MLLQNLGIFLITICAAINIHAATPPPPTLTLDTTKIEQLTGAKGQLDLTENVFKVSVPRDDLKVTINKVTVTPALGLDSWAVFKNFGDMTMVMGDLVLTLDQVNTVMSFVLDNGFNVTALHNHFFWENPRLMFMHIEAMGNAEQLATTIGKIFAKVKATSQEKITLPNAVINPKNTKLDTQEIAAILGVEGILNDGVYKVFFGRTGSMHGYPIGGAMDLGIAALFAGTDAQAVVYGDFGVHESELQDVLKALRGADIYVVAIHHHMLFEDPRYIFVHYYGIASSETLARGLKAAVDKTQR